MRDMRKLIGTTCGLLNLLVDQARTVELLMDQSIRLRKKYKGHLLARITTVHQLFLLAKPSSGKKNAVYHYVRDQIGCNRWCMISNKDTFKEND